MKNFWKIVGLLLILTGCEEANEIYGYDEIYNLFDYSLEVEGQYYEGPVYLDATSWGAMAHVHDKFVNKGARLLVSEADNAEGGWEIDVTSNMISVNELSAGVRYYYCLCFPEGWIKSEIKSVVTQDISALGLLIEQKGDSVFCTIQDKISSAFIQEKGFKLGSDYSEIKYVVEGERFAFSIPEVVKEYSVRGGMLVYAYVQTPNGYHRSYELGVDFGQSVSGNNSINREEITLSAISEETIGDVDYLKCTVTGYVDSVYFYKDWDDKPQNRFYPDKKVKNEDGTMTTFYVKKRFFQEVRMKAFYKISWNGYLSNYSTRDKSSVSYTPKQFNIRSLDEFLEFVKYGHSSDEIYVSLFTDITLPSDMRLSINLAYVTLDGQGHTLDGVSYFPLFRDIWYSTVKNLKIGTDETVYEVKKGTSSLSTTSNEVPGYFLWDDSDYVTFENCEVRGTFKVNGREDFCLHYVNYWQDENKLAGLSDYTKTEYVTTSNN